MLPLLQAVFSIPKVNITQLNVGTNELIAFNESNNLKEVLFYREAQPGQHTARPPVLEPIQSRTWLASRKQELPLR